MTTEDKIASFGKLPDGWHYGSGHPPTPEMIAKATAYANLFTLLGFAETDAFPGIDGEIMVSAYDGEHCLEVTAELNETFRFAHEIGDKEETYEEGLSATGAIDRITRARDKIKSRRFESRLREAVMKVVLEQWRSSDPSIQFTTLTLGETNSPTWHLDLSVAPMERWESRVSSMLARLDRANLYVPMSMNTMEDSPRFQQSSGFSMNPIYQKVVA